MKTYAETVMEQARQEFAQEYTFRLLVQRLGKLSKRAEASIRRLSVEQLIPLGVDSTDFKSVSDLTVWLRTNKPDSVKG